AGGNAVNSPESPLTNGTSGVMLSETDASSEIDSLSKTDASSEIDSLSENNSLASSAAASLGLKIEIAQQTEQRAVAESGLAGMGLQGLPAGVRDQAATQVLDGARSGVKNKSFESLNAAVSANLAAVTEQAEVTDSADVASTDQIEQVDFSQLIDSVRKQEQPELAPRILSKAPVLTEAEQQVLDKRVNLHNNSASSELHEKISIMAGKELQTATIRLDPAELGSLNIKLVVHHDQASVIIQAQNGQSRDLLEQQLPRLREMLQQQGITLGDTQVQADSGGQQQSGFQQTGQQSGQRTDQNNSNNSENYVVDSQTEVPVSTQHWQDSAKGVDFYA
ncbi:MAG: flagellar hook-length control protein FliK, partial [Moritella sp.]